MEITKIESKEIQMVDIEAIIPNPKNANRHSKEQIERLCKLIRFQGFRNPLIVSNRTGFLVVGHGRLEAAHQLGMLKVPVIYQDFENEAQEYAYLISDNEIARWAELDKESVLAELDDIGIEDIELLGIEEFEIPEVEVIPQTDEDEVPEVENPITRRGDIWLLGKHRLMCGDSTMIDDVEKLGGNLADSFYCDPPYGISYSGKGQPGNAGGITKNGQNFGMIKNDDTIDIAKDAWCLARGMSDNLVFWGANFYPTVLDDSCTWVVWNKKTVGENYSDCELAATTQKGRIKMFEHQWHGMIKESEHGQRRVHPTQKPIALAEWCFDEYKMGDKICDLFGGSGSSLIACEKTNRSSYTMELDEKYCDVIINRWQNYTGKKATLESTNQTYEELCDVRK